MKKLLFPLLMIMLIATSCNKEIERTYGFWWNESTVDALYADGITELNFYVNEEFIGKEYTNVYWTGEPSCNDDLPKKTFIGKEKDYVGEDVIYVVKDQYGYPLVNDHIYSVAECNMIQLYY